MSLSRTLNINNSHDIRIASAAIATKLGSLDAATIIDRLYFWMTRPSNKIGMIHEGVKWIRNSYPDWLEQFPWLTIWKIRQIFERLRELKLIKFAQLSKRWGFRDGWYTIDLEALQIFLSDTTHQCEVSPQIDESDSLTSYQKILPKEISSSNPKRIEESVKKEERISEGTSDMPLALREEINSQQSKQQDLEARKRQALAEVELLTHCFDRKNDGEETSSEAVVQEFTSLTQKEKEVLIEVREFGIELTPWIKKAVLDAGVAIAKQALSAMRNYRRSHGVRNAPGLLIKSLRNPFKQESTPADNEGIHPVSSNYSEEFLTWYSQVKGKGNIEDMPYKQLPTDFNREPLVRLKRPDPRSTFAEYLMPWRQAKKIAATE